MVIAGISVSLIINILVSFKIIRGGCYLALEASVIWILLTGIATIKFGFMNIIPIAMKTVVDHIQDGIIVINEDYRVLDLNKAFRNSTSKLYDLEINDNILDKLKELEGRINLAGHRLEKLVHEAINKMDSVITRQSLSFGKEIRHYDMQITPILKGKTYSGSVIVLRDMTDYVDQINTIKDYQSLLERNIESVTRDKQELLIRNAITEKMAHTDSLTDMYNHRTFQEYFDQVVVMHSQQNKHKLQLAIIDIDDFKKLNDTYGHAIGDIVLKRVANKIKSLVTADDIPSRYGGEEFAIIFTNKDISIAYNILENIRRSIEREKIREAETNVTISIGLHEYIDDEGKQSSFVKADEALYTAKHTGKNKTVVA
jgi:diguanylate cyclase (GGDEF)-like protein